MVVKTSVELATVFAGRDAGARCTRTSKRQSQHLVCKGQTHRCFYKFTECQLIFHMAGRTITITHTVTSSNHCPVVKRDCETLISTIPSTASHELYLRELAHTSTTTGQIKLRFHQTSSNSRHIPLRYHLRHDLCFPRRSHLSASMPIWRRRPETVVWCTRNFPALWAAGAARARFAFAAVTTRA